ncbi:claw keratin-like isoform X3 [Camarhynchus parvulus]|uniref:claw keratin-like isoform X3 n=1 Tax=Geospiza parvula TaxID=87175 RepID=UPI00123813FE|nr:claw keratin-like isoform X3 [Camarhynchus parvulus]XP_030821083.1 claw keratin-like isoform X3 [Camarhynchus parvulus]
MSCSSLCVPSCGVATPAPVADTCNEPCVRQCPDSTVVIQPPASVVTFPGPILSSFPQQSAVGSAGAPYVGAGAGGAFGSRGAYGGYGGYGALGGYGGYGGYGGWGCGGYGGWGYGGLGNCGYGGWSSSHRYLNGNCGPC